MDTTTKCENIIFLFNLVNTCCVVCTNTQYCKLTSLTEVNRKLNFFHFKIFNDCFDLKILSETSIFPFSLEYNYFYFIVLRQEYKAIFAKCWDPYKRTLNRPKFSETVTVSALAGQPLNGQSFGRSAWRN
ncbi:hypothetical protein BpHYR1_047472 [Brachionus plicatilis]|uniref:Uncharacterized protein n=1 Tax=Brachionus plicatilis TaxID=10195 RepID=A0A3M7T4H6_BRAPC|nr:hypothetical protein BpHYR1_047472 [Brachionus plicatilis]